MGVLRLISLGIESYVDFSSDEIRIFKPEDFLTISEKIIRCLGMNRES